MTDWRALLRRRIEKKWDSFSWIALRPLISSINDVINRATPRLVNSVRDRWNEEYPVGANDRWDAHRVIDRRGDSSFLVVGDTGEQDASQYVVVPGLEERKHDARFIVILSDVIYPSGDVNDYADGFYVPYLGLKDKPIYALPGNHDWYDGLTGFMWWFCHRGPLPADAYGMTGAKWWEWPARMLWRRPSKPKSRLQLEEKRGHFTPGDALQPGAYFAIDTAHARLVCIDTGIANEIGTEQADWLLQVSRSSDLPKVLLTGKPLWVNNEEAHCRISNGTKVGSFTDVNALVKAPQHGYVATIGGDVHNFQAYEIDGIRHVVSGGGGAYTSATHTAVVRTDPRATAMYPDGPDSFRLFAGVLLPKIWRLERALMAALGGVGLGAIFVRLADGDDQLRRGVLVGCGIAFAACVLARVPMRPAATKSGVYRAVAVLVSLLLGFTLGLAGWWLVRDHFFPAFWAWLGITGGVAALAWLMRRTGWWRPRMPGFEIPLGWRLAALLPFAALIAAAFAFDAPDEAKAAALVLGVPALVGWWLRHFGWWKVGAHLAAYVVQLTAGLLALDAWVLPDRAPTPFWGVAGVALGLALVLAAIVVLFGVLFPVAGAAALRHRLRLRAAWGYAGGLGQILLPVLAGLVVWGEWAILAGADRDARRLAVTALITLIAPIAVVFGLDWIRRRTSRTAYKPVALAALVVVLGLLWLLGVQDGWVPRAAVAACVVVGLAVMTALVSHLVFLGGQWLIGDREAHQDREGKPDDWLFSEREASDVVAWRRTGVNPPKKSVRRRANVAFPLPSQPSGPFQQKVAEFCDTDSPPFRKNFLIVTSDADALTITPYWVTGEEGKACEPGDAITVPLPSADEGTRTPTGVKPTRT